MLNSSRFHEFPLALNPQRIVEAFDSYHYFKDFRNNKEITDKKKIKQFLNSFNKIIRESIKHKLPINAYFDPQDVVKNNPLDKPIEMICLYNLSVIKYYLFLY